MTEDVLQLIWQHRLYRQEPFLTEEGEVLEIIHPGLLNRDAGPDFFNAKIKIDGILWAGNVEVHHQASDWHRHKHHQNPAFDNVILHVVTKSGGCTFNSKGRKIPVWLMPLSRELRDFSKIAIPSSLPCSQKLTQISTLNLCAWTDRMLLERLQAKTASIAAMLQQGFSRQKVLFVLMSRSFGFGLNNDAFEQLARQTPWELVLDLKHQPLALKALLLGQGAMLPKDRSKTSRQMVRTYQQLKRQHALHPIKPEQWKRLRIRPFGFPRRRLLQLAEFLQHDFPALETLNQTPHISSLEKAWLPGPLSRKALQLVLINSVIPFVFALNWLQDKPEGCQRALDWLQQLPPENNRIIRIWESKGLRPLSAADSQALLHLHRQYCVLHRCLHCRIGHLLLAQHD